MKRIFFIGKRDGFFISINNKDKNNKDSPIAPPGGLAYHLAPEAASRREIVEDSHWSDFSSSDLYEAIFFIGKRDGFCMFMNKQDKNNKDSPIAPPGGLAHHLGPETTSRRKIVEDSHSSDFSSSHLHEAKLFCIGKSDGFFISINN